MQLWLIDEKSKQNSRAWIFDYKQFSLSLRLFFPCEEFLDFSRKILHRDDKEWKRLMVSDTDFLRFLLSGGTFRENILLIPSIDELFPRISTQKSGESRQLIAHVKRQHR